MLAGMLEPADLRRAELDGRVVVTVGPTVVFDYASTDAGMRNLAVVVLTGLRFTGQRVAEVLGLSEEYVARLRTRAREQGSAGLVRRRGRPAKLTEAMLAQARRWRAEGVSNVEIGRRLGVHDSTVSRALAAVVVAPLSAEQSALALAEPVAGAVREQHAEALSQAPAGGPLARGVVGVDADGPGQGGGGVERGHPDRVGDQLGLHVQDLLTGVDLGQRHPGRDRAVRGLGRVQVGLCGVQVGGDGVVGLVG